MNARRLAMLAIPVTLLLLLTIGIQAFALSHPLKDRYAYETNELRSSLSTLTDIEILDIYTQPSDVHVGDTFRINATVVNNTPNPITFQDACVSPLSVVFDKNVVTEHEISCLAFSIVEVKSGQVVSVVGPSSGIAYRAYNAGNTNATVTFTYEVQNQTSSVSKPFVFTIIPENNVQVNSERVYIKASVLREMNNTADNGYVRLVTGWNLKEEKGTIVLLTADGYGISSRTILRFIPTITNCIHEKTSECIDARLIHSNSEQYREGSAINLEVDKTNNTLFVKQVGNANTTNEVAFKIYKIKTWSSASSNKSVVVLGEGQRDGPLLVEHIYPDHIEGLNFREYPLAMERGTPITLHIGGSASNGCTVTLTLLEIHDKTATFLKTVEMNKPCPICLSGDTFIDTPNGPVNIKKLKDGMTVWTLDTLGHKQPAIILKAGKAFVPSTHMMIHIVLDDGRELFASPGHPTADGRLFGDLTQGDMFDNSRVRSIERVPYNETYTYDILPSGSTGFYWANGILVGSTLIEKIQAGVM